MSLLVLDDEGVNLLVHLVDDLMVFCLDLGTIDTEVVVFL
jgi:hypothetical protein